MTRFIYKYTYIVIYYMLRNMKQSRINRDEVLELFRQHLEEHHHIDTEDKFSEQLVKEHLRGENTLIPVTIFSNDKLSPLETIVKYLREEENLSNSKVAILLGRSPAAIWITYRNAVKKMPERLKFSKTGIFVSTETISLGRLSVLETIAYNLHDSGITYNKIGRLLNRDERTIWTVCSRARKKLAR